MQSTLKTSTEKKSQKTFSLNDADWYYRQAEVERKKIIMSQSRKRKDGNIGYRFLGFDKWTEQALDVVLSGNMIFEDFLMCKPYIDYEYHIDLVAYETNTSYYEGIALKRMAKMVEYISSAMKILMNDSEFFSDIKISKSHGKTRSKTKAEMYKFSYHFVVNCDTERFKDPMCAKALVLIIQDNLANDRDVVNHIDMAVYKSHPFARQKMRCLFSNKSCDDNRILEPIDTDGKVLKRHDVNITDYIISYFHDIDKIQFIDNGFTELIENGNGEEDENDEECNKTRSRSKSISRSKSMPRSKSVPATKSNDKNNSPKIKQFAKKKKKDITKEVKAKIALRILKNEENAREKKKIKDQSKTQDKTENEPHDINDEKLTQYNLILRFLKNVISTAFFRKPSDLKTMDTIKGIHSFGYDHGKDTCIYGAKHDRIDGYVCVYESHIYAGCNSAECNKTKNVHIGSFDTPEEDWKLSFVMDVIMAYTPDNDTYMKLMCDYMNNSKLKILGLKGEMSTGKTISVAKMMKAFMIKNKLKRILAFSPRQAYARDAANSAYDTLGFSNYLDLKVYELRRNGKLIISLESTHKLFTDKSLLSYDLVIVDECESLLLQFFSGTVKSSKNCLKMFTWLLKTAKKVIFIDADMTIGRTVAFMKDIAKTDEILIIKNNYVGPPRDFKFMNDSERFNNIIFEKIEKGENVCVVITGKEYGLNLLAKIKENSRTLKIFQIRFVISTENLP